MGRSVLGISAYYHDSAAAVVCDGRLVAAVQEERFSRRKFDARFPRRSIEYCLSAAELSLGDLDAVVFYEKPFLKFERLLETYLATVPRGIRSFLAAMPAWVRQKANLKAVLRRELAGISRASGKTLPPLLFTEHHRSHAASAFYPSPFECAAVLCLDGVGEWTTTSLWLGSAGRLAPRWELDFPHSLGLLYSAFTYFAGFKVNSGEYKLMGLAPYGEPRYAALIRDRLIDVKPDGTYRLNLEYFDYETGLRMTNERFAGLFGGAPRPPDAPVTRREMDLARSIQEVTEEVVLRLAKTARNELDTDCLCLAGGVALNCVANGRVLREAGFRGVWVQPAAGDAGGAAGAAWCGFHEYFGEERIVSLPDGMSGAYLGPSYTDNQIRAFLNSVGAPDTPLSEEDLLERVSDLLAEGKIVGWFQGRMEFGPRALGARSILGDPRSPEMWSTMNLRIKFRESFRPFAPSVLTERSAEYFDLAVPSPYMQLVAPVRESLRVALSPEEVGLEGLDRRRARRSGIPAVTHVDGSARVQTVHRETNPLYHALLERFERKTGCAVLVNTSFNVRGEPIVCTPEDALGCFLRTEIDVLVMGHFLLRRVDVQPLAASGRFARTFEDD